MKKLLLTSTAILAFTLCSCSTAKGVQNKSFTYSSCAEAKAKEGTTDEKFYVETNPVCSSDPTKEGAIDRLVSILYYHGSAAPTLNNNQLDFAASALSGLKYQGKETTLYRFNDYEPDEGIGSQGGYYIALNDDFTSILLLDDDTDGLSPTVTIGIEDSSSGSFFTRKTRTSYYYEATYTNTSTTYDASAKQLTVNLDVTYLEKVNDVSSTYVMSYSLVFAEK